MTCLSHDALSKVKISDASRSYLGQRTKPLLSYWWHATFITRPYSAHERHDGWPPRGIYSKAGGRTRGRASPDGPQASGRLPSHAEGQALAHARFHRFMESRSDVACVAQQIFTNLLTRPAELFYNLWAGPMTRTAKSLPRARSMTC